MSKSNKRIDPETGIAVIADWGPECARGFVRIERFGPSQRVIAAANRTKQKRAAKIMRKL